MFKLKIPNNSAFAVVTSPTESLLLDEEKQIIADVSSNKRIQEFTMGRNAARLALKNLGLDHTPAILQGSKGEPIWPEKISGSISHVQGCAVALVAYSSKYYALGIDILERQRKFHARLAEKIATPNELNWIEESKELNQQNTLLLFSAKESIYKALSGYTTSYINYQDVEILPKGKFSLSAKLMRSLSKQQQKDTIFTIDFELTKDYILTYCLLGAQTSRSALPV